MTILKYAKHFIAIALCVLVLVACDQDPFGLSYRHIGGGYFLHRWEDGITFYVDDESTLQRDDEGGGVIKGTVEKIGWNKDYIIVKRKSNYGGDPIGWMLLSTRNTEIRGPFTDAVIRDLPEASGIQFVDAAEAWDMLR